jgi:hypothetical protein
MLSKALIQLSCWLWLALLWLRWPLLPTVTLPRLPDQWGRSWALVAHTGRRTLGIRVQIVMTAA